MLRVPEGQNDCAGEGQLRRLSTVDYQGNSWKLVPKGSCVSMDTSCGRVGPSTSGLTMVVVAAIPDQGHWPQATTTAGRSPSL
jgi:hypothetical protein